MSISLKKRPTTALISLLFCSLLLLGQEAWGGERQKKELRELIQKGSVLLADEQGRILYAYREKEFFVPASIVKILTAQIALELLGPKHRFHTRFYATGNRLWIQGGGDPFLVSEEIRLIAQELKARGLTRVRELGLDDSLIALIEVPGLAASLNPYDALNGALVVNFNSLFVGRDQQGRLYSAEPQTPLTPLGQERGTPLKAGFTDRINLTLDPAESLRYSGELFLAILAQEGLDTKQAKLRFGPVPQGLRQVLDHQSSRDLTEVLKGLLRFSNNFIANQLLLSLDQQPPLEMRPALRRYRKKAQEILGPWASGAVLEEGSGLSRGNRVSARQMLTLLQRFQEHAGLLSKKHQTLLKSGTLSGVYNYAGYIQGPQGLRPFVILLNQKQNQRDRILTLLQHWED